MNDSNYSPSLVSALKIARGMALQDKHNTFGVSHLVMAMFAEKHGSKGNFILDAEGCRLHNGMV